MKDDKKYLLSVDLGTQGTKTAILNLSGDVICSAFAEGIFHEEAGAITQDAQEILQGVTDTIREVLQKAQISPENIAAIGVVGMMAGIVGIDRDWNPVTPYDTGLDDRCEVSIKKMQAIGEEKVIAICGCPIIVAQGAKMYWWKEYQKEIFDKVEKFVPISTYICGAMAGLHSEDAYIDYTHIHLTCFADIEKNCWSGELLQLFDFPGEKLPRIIAPYDIVGKVSGQFAKETGLEEGIPIVAGCGDTAASSLGAGMTEKNTVLDIAGTAAVMMACVDEYKPDVEKKILLYPRSVLPGMWIPFGFVLGGQTMDWYVDQVKWNEAGSFGELDQEAANIENDNLFFLPFFAGRICPSDSNFTGDWVGLKFYHKRGHMFKSIMESIGYEYRFYLARIKELFPDITIKEIITSAGGAKSRTFIQTKSNILNVPFIPLVQKDTSHKAAAVIAGYGVGIYKDMAETARKMSCDNQEERVEPDQKMTQQYNGKYEKYLNVVSYMEKFHAGIKL